MNPKPPRGRWLHGWRWLALAVAAQPWVLSAQPAPSGARVLSSGGDGASVALGGSMGEQVVLIIDGRTRVVRVGEAGPGRAPQRLGSTPVRVGSPARGMPMPERLVLQAGGDRLYRGEGEINGRAISGVVDTGASVMVVPAAQARRLGLPEQGGREVDVQTAAGRSVGRRVKIDRVRLGPLEARDVDAVVIDVDLPYVLYGNSFLQDFHLQWGQGRLTLSVAPPP
jgi:aspartyl protease family protein